MIARLRARLELRRRRAAAVRACSYCGEPTPRIPFGSDRYVEQFCSSEHQAAWEFERGVRWQR